MWLTSLNHWNGVSLFLGGDSSPDLQLFTDASWSHGYGGYLIGKWFQAPWLPQHLLNPNMGISIDWQELFAIYIACYLGGPSWSGKHICMWCDNLPVKVAIQMKGCLDHFFPNAFQNSVSNKFKRVSNSFKHVSNAFETTAFHRVSKTSVTFHCV